MSLEGDAPDWSTTSGAIQYGEPTTDESGSEPTRVATPKSATAGESNEGERGRRVSWVKAEEGLERERERGRGGRTLDAALLGGEDVAALDVAVDDALVVQVQQALEDLERVQADERLGDAAELFDDGRQRAVLAVLEDDVERGRGAGVAAVLDDVGVCLGAGRGGGQGWIRVEVSREARARVGARWRFLRRSISDCKGRL